MLFKKDLPKREFYAGLIGCGYFARYAYIPALNKVQCPLACSGLYSRSPQSSKTFQKSLVYKSHTFDSFDALANSGVKAVIITTPNHKHLDYILNFLGKGLDVFCEKPVTNTVTEALQVKSALENSASILMIGFNRRYTDRVKKLRKLIETKEVGQIHEVHAFHNQDIEDHLKGSEWLSDVQKSGGGVLHNAGIHLINTLIHLFGPIVKVSSEFRNLRLPENFGEDTASCRFHFKSGVQGYLSASYVNAVGSRYEHIVIKGENGSILSDLSEKEIIVEYDRGDKETIDCEDESTGDSIYNELVHFHDRIIDRTRPHTDIDDSIETLKVVEAAKLASTEKHDVFLSL